MPDLTITLDAMAVELITSALYMKEIEHRECHFDEAAAAYHDLHQQIVNAWVEQNPGDYDLPWRA